MLDKLPALGCPANLDVVGQGLIALAVGADGGCLDILYSFSRGCKDKCHVYNAM